MTEAHEVYKELSTVINDLSNDMIKGLVSLRAVSGDNKADIERLEQRFEQRIEVVQHKIEDLQRSTAALEAFVSSMKEEAATKRKEEAEAKKAKTQLKVEDTKGRWAFWVAVVGGGAGVITTIASIVAKAFGWD